MAARFHFTCGPLPLHSSPTQWQNSWSSACAPQIMTVAASEHAPATSMSSGDDMAESSEPLVAPATTTKPTASAIRAIDRLSLFLSGFGSHMFPPSFDRRTTPLPPKGPRRRLLRRRWLISSTWLRSRAADTARAAETAGVVRRGAYVGPLGRQARVPKMPHLARRVAAEACGSATVHRGGRAFDDLGRLRLVALGAFIHRERREPRTVGDARSAAGPCWLGARLADVSDVAAGTGIARSSRGGTAEAT